MAAGHHMEFGNGGDIDRKGYHLILLRHYIGASLTYCANKGIIALINMNKNVLRDRSHAEENSR
jgi:hypothetical protein